MVAVRSVRRANGMGHGLVTSFPVRAINRQDFDSWECLGKGGGVAKTHLRTVCADVPFVVLNQPHDGKLTEG